MWKRILRLQTTLTESKPEIGRLRKRARSGESQSRPENAKKQEDAAPKEPARQKVPHPTEQNMTLFAAERK